MLCLVSLSCLSVVMSVSCHPVDWNLPGSYVHGDPPGKNTTAGACCHALLQRIFPTQGANPGLPIAGGFFTIWATRETLIRLWKI